MGQLDYTTDLDEKIALYEQFWSTMTPTQQRQFLADWGITHVLASSYDAPFVKDTPLFEGNLIYERDEIKIWAIP
jgi:hypothetical protein